MARLLCYCQSCGNYWSWVGFRRTGFAGPLERRTTATVCGCGSCAGHRRRGGRSRERLRGWGGGAGCCSGVAAAAFAVCAGAVLRVPGRAGDDPAVVDAGVGRQHVYSLAAGAGGGAASRGDARVDLGAGVDRYMDWDFGSGALPRPSGIDCWSVLRGLKSLAL